MERAATGVDPEQVEQCRRMARGDALLSGNGGEGARPPCRSTTCPDLTGSTCEFGESAGICDAARNCPFRAAVINDN